MPISVPKTDGPKTTCPECGRPWAEHSRQELRFCLGHDFTEGRR